MWPWRRRPDEDFANEIDAHIAHETKRLVEDEGLSVEEANARARRSFGNIAHTQERFYESSRPMWFEDFTRDVRWTARGLRKSPGFAAIVVLTLALGIGANTAIFSVLNALLLTPLPYQDANRVVRLVMNMPAEESPTKRPRRASMGLTQTELQAIQENSQALSRVGTATTILRSWPGQDDSAHLQGAFVSASLFDMLAVRPALGRAFGARDETQGAEPVIILSHGVWQRLLGSDPAAVGRVIALDVVLGPRMQYRHTVVGVMPRDFSYPDPGTQFWIPFQPVNAKGVAQRGNMVAQLRPGVPIEAASAEISSVLRQLRPKSPKTTYELVRERDESIAEVKPALPVLTLAAGLVLLIACVNVANLLLARASVRQRELAVRSAIGAGRGRLVRQMLTESTLLALFGLLAGIALALGGIQLFKNLAHATPRIDIPGGLLFPRLDEIGLNVPVLMFAAGICLITGLLCGLAPALRHSRSNPMEAFRGSADRTQSAAESFGGFGLRNILVVAQIGLAMMLLISGGLLLRSFWTLSHVELGYDPDQVLTFQVSLPAHRYSDAQLKTFAESFTGRLRAMPTVHAAAYANQLPMVDLRNSAGGLFKTPDPQRPYTAESPDIRLVSRDYLSVMGIRVVAGRGFQEDDREGSERVLLINQAVATRDFPGENPVGQFVFVGRDLKPWHIVGIVENVRQFGLDQEPTPQIFADVRQWSAPTVPIFPAGAYYAVRTQGDASTLAASARAIARELDAQAALFNIAPMEHVVATTIARPRMYAILVTVFAMVGLVLALLGVYSVVAYAVTQRTREIGIRMSLGAERRSVVGLVLWHSSAASAAGILLGCLGAIGLSGFLDNLLFGMTTADPATFAITAVGFAITATLAAFVPALRATKIDPLRALRVE
jgi:putative ABC transport system permease protein